jgi:UDP-2,4-diacetamido-2,4,6-trideoxy-beta-L-altropyranose hydrolase
LSELFNDTLLLVRADASHQIGSGHLMRAIALGSAWRRAGGKSILISSCSDDLARRASRGFDKVHRLADPDSTEDGVGCMLHNANSFMQEYGQKHCWIALDGYHFDADYQAAIRARGFPLIVIDDYAHLSRYHADIILNQNAGAEKFQYHAPDARLLCGASFVLLREEFFGFRDFECKPTDRTRILITFGGSDSANMSLLVLRAIDQIKKLKLTTRVIIGGMNSHAREIENFCKHAAGRIEIVRQTENMAGHMHWADIAISAAGTTSWELCYLGVPSLLTQVAENQTALSENLAAAGAAECLGWYASLTEDGIGEALVALINNPRKRASMSTAAKQLVDGKGSDRLFETMHQLTKQSSTELV